MLYTELPVDECDRLGALEGSEINEGKIIHDGMLSEIIDRFSSHKIVTLRFRDGDVPQDFAGVGEVIELVVRVGEGSGSGAGQGGPGLGAVDGSRSHLLSASVRPG